MSLGLVEGDFFWRFASDSRFASLRGGTTKQFRKQVNGLDCRAPLHSARNNAKRVGAKPSESLPECCRSSHVIPTLACAVVGNALHST